MPGNILMTDTFFPQFQQGQDDGQKIDIVLNYLFMLKEQLRYSMSNLEAGNFNDGALIEMGHLITDPVYMKIEDSDQNIASLTIKAGKLESRMENAEGNVSAIQVTAADLGARMTDAEGSIFSLNITAQQLDLNIRSAEGEISSVAQKVDSLRLSVTNGEKSSVLSLMAGSATISSQTIQFTGAVSFADLAGEGTTKINGRNITTGMIKAIDIEGSVFRSILSTDGTVGGEVTMCYDTTANIAGGIRLDDQGAGTVDERKYRMFIYTNSVAGAAFAIKIKSASGVSMEAAKNVYLKGGTTAGIEAPDIRLKGNVYINGILRYSA